MIERGIIENKFRILISMFVMMYLLTYCSFQDKKFERLEFSVIVGDNDKGVRGFTLLPYSDSLYINYISLNPDKLYNESFGYKIKINRKERKAIINAIIYLVNPLNLKATHKTMGKDKEIIFRIKEPNLLYDTLLVKNELNTVSENNISANYSYIKDFSEISNVYNELIEDLKNKYPKEFKDW